jgi:hypothetical protein
MEGAQLDSHDSLERALAFLFCCRPATLVRVDLIAMIHEVLAFDPKYSDPGTHAETRDCQLLMKLTSPGLSGDGARTTSLVRLPATAVAGVAATAAAATLFARTSFVDGQCSTLQLFAVHSGDGRLGFPSVGHFHEAKASGTVRVAIGDDSCG